MTCLNACIAARLQHLWVPAEDLKSSKKFHGVLDHPFCEQKTDVVNICTDKGRYKDKIRKEPLRGCSLKGFSLFL